VLKTFGLWDEEMDYVDCESGLAMVYCIIMISIPTGLMMMVLMVIMLTAISARKQTLPLLSSIIRIMTS
jgi:hypothetical protein